MLDKWCGVILPWKIKGKCLGGTGGFPDISTFPVGFMSQKKKVLGFLSALTVKNRDHLLMIFFPIVLEYLLLHVKLNFTNLQLK